MNTILNAEFNKLITIQHTLEKSVRTGVDRLSRFLQSDEKALIRLEKLDMEVEIYARKLLTVVKELIISLKAKKQLLEENNVTCITDFHQFREEMVNIQKSILDLKCSTKLEITNLKETEDDLCKELEYYDNKVLEWSKPLKQYVFNNPENLKPKMIRSTHLCKEVKQFLDFVHSSGGHENGWKREDHQLYIKLRAKYKNEDLVTHLHDLLPDITKDTIRAHDEWYKKYLCLENGKKEALKKWRLGRSNKNTVLPTLNTRLRINIEPEKGIQEKLLEWKAEKEEKQKTLKNNLEDREREKKQLEDIKKKRQDEIKLAVRHWRQMTCLMEENAKQELNMKRQEEKRKRAAEANKMIKEFQSQDDIYIHRTKQMKKKTEKYKPQIVSRNLAKRDPNRLLRPTQQWINRIYDDSSYNKLSGICSIKSLPKLGIPEWRQDIK